MLKAFNTSIEALNDLAGSIGQTLNCFDRIREKMEGVSVQLNTISYHVQGSTEKFADSQARFAEQNDRFLEQNKATILVIKHALGKAEEVSTDYSNRFATIQSGLQGIFSQLKAGLEGYQSTVGESLNEYLSKYSEALTNTAQLLSGAASKQEEILEELTEQLESFRRNRI